MEYESALLRAQIDSIKREPTILSSPGTPNQTLFYNFFVLTRLPRLQNIFFLHRLLS